MKIYEVNDEKLGGIYFSGKYLCARINENTLNVCNPHLIEGLKNLKKSKLLKKPNQNILDLSLEFKWLDQLILFSELFVILGYFEEVYSFESTALDLNDPKLLTDSNKNLCELAKYQAKDKKEITEEKFVEIMNKFLNKNLQIN